MSQSLRADAPARPRSSLADVCPKPAKAELRGQEGASSLRAVAAEAIRRVTSQKAAATDIGIHEARLSHKLSEGTLTLAQLEQLEDAPRFYAEFGRALVETYGTALEAPKARAQRVIREARAKLDELSDYMDYVL